jgi:formiminoglutamase
MHKAPDMSLWTGRIDAGPVATGLRWHQCVTPLGGDQQPGIALLGVASDEGVRRNLGRVGAAAGPAALRRALGGQAWHLARPVYDAGDLCCAGGQLERLQEEQAVLVQRLLEQGHFPLLLGGGHEIAFGSFLGLARQLPPAGENAPIGIINCDAHFDLRRAAAPNSGTAFLQIAEQCRAEKMPFHYCCLGVSETANTRALFDQADRLGVLALRDEELVGWRLAQVEPRLAEFIRPCRAIYLSIDLDLLPAATAPGVSAPAARGVPLAELEQLLIFIRALAGDRLRVADIAEYNPQYDLDGRTARVAARLCHLLCRN